MNSKIQEILQRQAQKAAAAKKPRLEIIPKDSVIKASAPAIFVDNETFFYTFNGRSLMVYPNQSTPYLSLPNETQSLVIASFADIPYVLMLDSKNKLEAIKLSEMNSGDRQTLTRNVQQLVKTKQGVFYVFVKNDLFYINSVSQGPAGLLGKHFNTAIKAKKLEIFPCDDGVFYIADQCIYDLNGDSLNLKGSFVYRCDGTIVVGRAVCTPCDDGEGELESKYELVSYGAEGVVLSSQVIKTEWECQARGFGAFIAVLNENKLHFFEIKNGILESASLLEIENLAFDFWLWAGDNGLVAYALVDPMREPCEESFSPLLCETYFAPEMSEMAEAEAVALSEDALDQTEQIVSASETARSLSAMKIRQTPSPSSTNHLLNAVKRSFEQQSNETAAGDVKLTADPEESSGSMELLDKQLVMDRFEKYAKENLAAAESATAQPRVRVRQAPAKPVQPKPSREPFANVDGSLEKAVAAALESVLVKNDSFVKDLVARAIVPALEAAVNEMRIQIVTELRRIDQSSKLDPLCGKTAAFKKLLNSGRVDTAIQELVKLKSAEFESILALIQPGMIEHVDSNSLSIFIGKLHTQMKKHFKDHQAKLLYDALVDIDVALLSIESLQSISAGLRYIKEIPQLAEPQYAELGVLVDYMSKKVRKRVAGMQ